MRQELIYSMKNIHRDDFNIYGYRFGKNGVKAACIVGSLRGHEVQQLYICSLLVKLLKDIELHGGIVGDSGDPIRQLSGHERRETFLVYR